MKHQSPYTNKDIYTEIIDLDKKYGRILGILYYKDRQGNFVNINNKMKDSGFCPKYVYKKKLNINKYQILVKVLI